MQFVIERDMFVEALARVAGTIETRVTVPILSNVFIDVRARDVLLIGTDQTIEVSVPCPAEVMQQGVTTVSADVLHKIVTKCPKGASLSVTLFGNELRIVCGRGKYALPTLPADDFPRFESRADGVTFQWSAAELRACIEKTRFAMSVDETRYYLNGIYFHAVGEELVAVATDGHMLSRKSVPLPAEASMMPGVILPRKTVAELLKFLPDRDCEIEVTASANALRVRLGEAELITKLIDGTYPDYQRLMPSAHSGRAILPRLALLAAIERVSVVIDSKSPSVALTLDGGEIRVSAQHAERGSGVDAVCDVAYEGRPVTVGADYRYIMAELRASGANQIALMLADGKPEDGPMLFEDVDGDGSHKMLLMPMRVRETMAQAEMEAA
jgi:DNA polymerase III subunit beta